MKQIKKSQKAKTLSKKEQKSIKGGYIPSLEEFCCGPRSQGWWIQIYPFLANDPYYNCGGVC